MDVDRLSELATQYYCNYVIIDKERILEGGKPEDLGLTKIAQTEHYDIYRNEKVDFFD